MTEKRFLTLDDLTNLPPPSWMIEGMFERASLTMLAGPSYSFKSFLLLDWLLNIASGRQWNHRKTCTTKVGYALGEGKSGLLKRINAWVKYNNPTQAELKSLNENFRTTFDVPQLVSKASVDNMLADLEKEGFKPEAIAIDTFARSMVGSDENDARDTGLWIDSADRLRQLGYGVIFLHHTKKNTENGNMYRGSSAIMGAMDTAMTLVRADNTCTLTVNKQKDHDEGAPMKFRRIIVGSGDTEQSCVLVPISGVSEGVVEVGGEGVSILDIHKRVLAELMEDATYLSDSERAKALALKLNISFAAAQSRVSRANREMTTNLIIEGA